MGRKEAYQEKIEAQLKEWSAKINELKAKAEKAAAEKKTELHKMIDNLRAKKPRIISTKSKRPAPRPGKNSRAKWIKLWMT